MRRSVSWLILAAAAVVSAIAFASIDAGSHSASDTIRPFVLLMTPVWAAALTGIALLRRRRPS